MEGPKRLSLEKLHGEYKNCSCFKSLLDFAKNKKQNWNRLAKKKKAFLLYIQTKTDLE